LLINKLKTLFFIYFRYEMLCGIPPFYNENLEKMYDLIKLRELRFPKRIKLSEEAQDIITQVRIYLKKLIFK